MGGCGVPSGGEKKKHAKATPGAFWREAKTGSEGEKENQKHQNRARRVDADDQGLGVRQREDECQRARTLSAEESVWGWSGCEDYSQ